MKAPKWQRTTSLSAHLQLPETRLVSEPELFDDKFGIAAAYTRAEAKDREILENFETVPLGSDSIDTIKRPHGHYFLATSNAAPSGAKA